MDKDGGSIDGQSTLLADVAKYYYDKDLSTKPDRSHNAAICNWNLASTICLLSPHRMA